MHKISMCNFANATNYFSVHYNTIGNIYKVTAILQAYVYVILELIPSIHVIGMQHHGVGLLCCETTFRLIFALWLIRPTAMFTSRPINVLVRKQ